jgi:hypothetical protein
MMEYLLKRPSWDCRACGKPWPCEPVVNCSKTRAYAAAGCGTLTA